VIEKYELTTLKDIFNNVPIDRVEDCMKELAALLIQAKTIDMSMRAVAHLTAGDAADVRTEWPEPVIWVDDGEGNIVTDIELNSEKIGSIKSNINSPRA